MKKCFINYLSIFFIILCYNTAYSQGKPVRIELEAHENVTYYVQPCAENGVLCFFKTNQWAKNNVINWQFNFYDEIFKAKWSKQIALEQHWQLQQFDYNNKAVYALFNYKTTYSSYTPYLIIKVNIVDGTYQTYGGRIPFKADISKFHIFNEKVIIGGKNIPNSLSYCTQNCLSLFLISAITKKTVLNIQPFLTIVDLNRKKDSLINLPKYSSKTFIDNIAIDSIKHTFFSVLNCFNNKKQNQLVINEHDINGKLLNTTILKTENEKKMLISAKIIRTNKKESIIIGTYDDSGSNYISYSSDSYSNIASGTFIAKINESNKIEYIKYYAFKDFSGFTDGVIKGDSIEVFRQNQYNKKQRKKQSFVNNMLVHDIVKFNEQYIFIGESYYPVYRTVYYTTYDYYGRPITNSYTVFEGYKYLYATVAGFSENGDMLWNNIFTIHNIQTYNLRKRIKLLIDGEDLLLVYATDGRIASKIIQKNQVVENLSFTKIETGINKEKNVNVVDDFIDYWYGNYFVAYGYVQTNTGVFINRNKSNVFYMNKLTFQ